MNYNCLFLLTILFAYNYVIYGYVRLIGLELSEGFSVVHTKMNASFSDFAELCLEASCIALHWIPLLQS